MNRKFGEELYLLRKQRNMSLEEVSRITNYSVKRIRELEKNNGLPSVDLLNNLSSCYKANLNIYFSTHDINFPSEIFHIYLAFREAIEDFNTRELEKLIKANECREYFLSGEGRKLILYSKGLICFSKKNYLKAKEFYEEALELDNIDISNIKEQNIYYSEITFSLLISYSTLSFYISEIDTSKYILETLHEVFNDVYFNDERLFIYNTSFMVRLHIITMNNLSCLYLGLDRLNEAIDLISISILFCQNHYRSGLLITLFCTKLEIFYKQRNYIEATKIAKMVVLYHEISNDKYKLNEFIKYINSGFPKIAENLEFFNDL